MQVGKTRNLPFDWNRFFVPSQTECVLACFAMSARYWKSFYPEINLPTDLKEWQEFASESFVLYRGTSIRDMMRKKPIGISEPIETAIPEKENIIDKPIQFTELVIKPHTPNGFESLVPFFQTRPPIPQILIFDQLLMTHNISGTYHAILLHSIDFEKEKLFVIDPVKHKLLEPYVYDFNRFRQAWKERQNLQIITYPKGMITVISGPSVGIVRQTDITRFTEGN